MNYQNIYDKLIDRARNRDLEDSVYREVHHVIPKCLGGSDSKDNLVSLTAEEHYVAHQLLVKINPKVHGLLYAALMMSVSPGHSPRKSSKNKVYGWLRKRFSETQLGRKHTEETKKKISEKNTGKKQPPRSEEYRKMISKVHAGKVVSEVTREKIRQANLGKKATPEAKANMRAGQLGRKATPETRAKMSAWQIGKIVPESVGRKISAANLGRKHTPETLEKMSASKVGLPNGPMSEETKRRISESRKGKPRSPEAAAASRLGKKTVATIEVSPGTFKKLNQSQLDRFNSTGSYLKPMGYNPVSRTTDETIQKS